MDIEEEYGQDSVNDTQTDFDYHINTEELPELSMMKLWMISLRTLMTRIEL